MQGKQDDILEKEYQQLLKEVRTAANCADGHGYPGQCMVDKVYARLYRFCKRNPYFHLPSRPIIRDCRCGK